MSKIDENKHWRKIVAKAWADEDYKRRLLDDPAAVLEAEGVDVPEGMQVNVVEATDKRCWLIIPPQPAGEDATTGEERLSAATWI